MATTTNALSNSVVSTDSSYLSNKTDTVSTSDELGKDSFIQLLVTQMKYQDPLNPMDNSEMLAQLAQFTALEQMMNVAQSSQKQLASNMIGKYVEYSYTDSTTGTTTYNVGKVDYVNINGDTPTLGIGELEVSIEDVYSVVDNSNIQATTSAFDVIGQTVQATMSETNASGTEETVIIEGEVQSISMKNSVPYVVIGTSGKKVEIPYSDVQNIVENTSVTGREVTATITGSDGKEQTISGTAEYIKVASDGTYVYVDGQAVDFNNITSVK